MHASLFPQPAKSFPSLTLLLPILLHLSSLSRKTKKERERAEETRAREKKNADRIPSTPNAAAPWSLQRLWLWPRNRFLPGKYLLPPSLQLLSDLRFLYLEIRFTGAGRSREARERRVEVHGSHTFQAPEAHLQGRPSPSPPRLSPPQEAQVVAQLLPLLPRKVGLEEPPRRQERRGRTPLFSRRHQGLLRGLSGGPTLPSGEQERVEHPVPDVKEAEEWRPEDTVPEGA